jgi:signal recognition particle GTPase
LHAGEPHERAREDSPDRVARIPARAEVLLVLDATVGQNGVTQAREFMGVAGVNGMC